MPDLADGETAEMQGSGAKPYLLKNTGGVYSCSCLAQRNQSISIEKRICKHLRQLRGEAAETARVGQAATAPLARSAPSVAKPSASKSTAPPFLWSHTVAEMQPPKACGESGIMNRVFCLALVGALLAAGETAPITTSIIAGAEVVTVAVPAGWSSEIVLAADRQGFNERPDRVLINGGYFDAQGQPDALLINGTAHSGRLRHDSPYSGFVWADATGAVHIARTSETPAHAVWAIQTGPLLVELGRSGINTTTSVAQRSVIALRRDQVLVIRTGRIGLKELADGLIEAGVKMAINLDGGPSSALQARIAGVSAERPSAAKVPYFLGFSPRTP